MDAYMYQAALYCEDCALELRAQLKPFVGRLDRDESDRWPVGPYGDGGGEADTPQHCDSCQAFLENPLTSDGVAYVQEAIDDGGGACVEEWSSFYGIERGDA
jgi:hypothetical protein